MTSRTELWEATKDGPVEGHVAFTVGEDEHVRLPYSMLATILQQAGMRRKISTDHGARISMHARQPAPAAPAGVPAPPRGHRWLTPRECHGTDAYCEQCSPSSPQRRVGPIA